MATCPNINHPDWKRLVSAVGETDAYGLYMANGNKIPEITVYVNKQQVLDDIKQNNAFSGTRVKNQYLSQAFKFAKVVNAFNPGLITIKPSKRKLGKAGQKLYYAEINEQVLGDNDKGQGRLFQVHNKNTKKANEKLNKSLMEFASKLGISVEIVEDLASRYEGGPVAVADLFKKIILVSKGKADITTLPEEVSHFAVAMLKDRSTVQRMRELVKETPTWERTLNLYKDNKEYQNADGTPNLEKLELEAVGQLLGDFLIKRHENLDKSLSGTIKRLLRAIMDVFKNFFKKTNENTIDEALIVTGKPFNGP